MTLLPEEELARIENWAAHWPGSAEMRETLLEVCAALREERRQAKLLAAAEPEGG